MTFNFNNVGQAFGLNDTPLSKIYGSGDYLLWPVEQIPVDYSSEYLTFEFKESGTLSVAWQQSHNGQYTLVNYYYSKNNGSWTSLWGNSGTISVTAGDKIRWKGQNNWTYPSPGTSNYIFPVWSSTAKLDVYGNIMSLLYLDSFSTNNTLPSTYTFGWKFYHMPIVDASNLVLPATTLTDYCYIRLFEGCQYLQVGPKLNAQTLTTGCYARMFADCTSINRITCKSTNISASNCLVEWVKNVGAGGVFTKKTGVSWPSGDSGIPTGWTVVNAS